MSEVTEISQVVPEGPPLPELERFAAVVGRLRRECPWDQKQTHRTLVPYLVEESYELVDAIRTGSDDELCEELGDVLLQVVLHAAIAEQEGRFTLEDVARGIAEKMVRRHPHVFAEEKLSASEHTARWESIKAQEKAAKEKQSPRQASIFASIPGGLPGLRLGQRYGEIAKKVRFDWPDVKSVFKKVKEEVGELKGALKSGKRSHIREELGDLFFVLANLARHLKLDADEIAAEGARKFRRRYDEMQKYADEEGLNLPRATARQKEDLWKQVKKSEKKKAAKRR